MDRKMKKVIITGASSMIGSALVRECLKEGSEVWAILRKGSGKEGRLPASGALHKVYGDLEDLSVWADLAEDGKALALPREADAFYHIAWAYTGAGRNKSIALQNKNVTYTLEGVRLAAALACSCFVGAGSQAEYGPKDRIPIGPDTDTRPTTPYGLAKLTACRMAFMYAKELEIACIWPRIFSVYGRYDKETTMITSSLQKMIQEEETDFTKGDQIWDYLYVKDAARALYLIGKKGKDGAIYCIGSGEGRPLREYIEDMAECAGYNRELGIGKRDEPVGTRVNLQADTRNLIEDTGFRPAYSFRQGMEETVDWIRSMKG